MRGVGESGGMQPRLGKGLSQLASQPAGRDTPHSTLLRHTQQGYFVALSVTFFLREVHCEFTAIQECTRGGGARAQPQERG